jgi:2-polyprenyl-3-methyl-5-hydroxy-6-metoxy-1,4-benzoquinol methylase
MMAANERDEGDARAPETAASEQARFDATYYAVGCGADYRRNEGWLRFFGGVADAIMREIRPATALDAGCAMGFLVEALRQRGVQAWGVDISSYAIAQVDPSVRAFCQVGSIAEPFEREFDLITCIEVLEHLPPADGPRAVANLCRHTRDVLFSSSPDDFAEATHLNVQPVEYWAELFAGHGFYRDLDFDAGFLTPWAARFRRRDDPPHRIVRDYERRLWRLQAEVRQLRQSTNARRAAEGAAHDDVDAIVRERDALRELVAQYERDRFMRMMRWLRGSGGAQP